jgi:hypothetical protein
VAAVVKQLTQNLKSERLRGPDPDYDSIDERFNTMWRAILRTPGNNGDSGPSLWQIFVSVALPLGLAMGGMWLHLSEKSDTQTIATAAQFAALQTSLADFKENQRIENERNNQRTTDLERAVRQLAADRWNGNARSGP